MATKAPKQSADIDENPKSVNLTDPSQVRVGDVMAMIDYVKVKSINAARTEMDVTNLLDGEDFHVTGKELIVHSMTADRYVEEKTLSRTKILHIFTKLKHEPFTVNFDKKDGENRTLRGKRIEQEDDLTGHSMVIDFDCGDDRPRQVDHRTIHWLVVQGTRYNVKKR